MTNRAIEENGSLSPRKIMVFLLVLIVLGVLARLYHINAPLLEYRFSRQQDNIALARNFYDNGMNIFYPQVDWRGNSPGYAEAEFQIYNYLVAILFHVFGPQEWVGRALSIAFYTLSALLLFRFTRRLFDERAALFAVFFYSFIPLSFYFTRAFQGDVLVALGSLAGVYYFWVWAEENSWGALALSALGIAVATLIKPPSLYLGLPLLYLCHRRFGWRLFREPVLWVFASIVILPSVFWYWHAFRLWEIYGNTFGVLGRYSVLGIWPLTDYRWLSLGKLLSWRLIFEIATPPGLLLLLVGFFAKPRQRNYLLQWWVVAFAIHVLLVPRGHYGHDYYQLPIVFVTAAYMALGTTLLLDKKVLSRGVIATILLVVLGFSVWLLSKMMHITDQKWDYLAYGERVQRLTESDAPIVFVSPRPFEPPHPDIYRHRTAQGEYLYSYPLDFYVSHRKGWSIDEVQASPKFVETLHHRGAKYFATVHPRIFERHPDLKVALERSYTPVEVTSKWAIYRLDNPSTAKPSAGDQVDESDRPKGK